MRAESRVAGAGRLALALVLSGLLSGCARELRSDMVLRLRDGTPPAIAVSAPVDKSYYATSVFVAGTATDEAGSGARGEIAAVSYEVVGTALRGEAAPSESGAFSFRFSTLGRSGTLVLEIRARDWNGNETIKSLTLLKGGSDIPSLAVAPSNKAAVLTWDEVGSAAGYTLFYTTNGTPPSAVYGESLAASSPQGVYDLGNGSPCVFQLKASSALGAEFDAWSDYVWAMPASATTLAPRVEGEFGQIRVSWPAFDGVGDYQVWRAASAAAAAAGLFDCVSGVVNGDEYVDSAVEDGVDYYYRVTPYGLASVESAANAAQTSPFPAGERLSIYNTPYRAEAVAVQGRYAYILDDDKLIVVNVADPRRPRASGSITVPNRGVDLAASATRVFVLDSSSGIMSIDASNPASMRILDAFPTDAGAVAAAGSLAYAVGGSGLEVIDAADPANLFRRGLFAAATGGAVAVSGGYAYVADYDTNLLVVDVSDPQTPAVAATLPLAGSPSAVAVSGSRAYVLCPSSGLFVVDIAIPASPSILGSYATALASSLAAEGDQVYLGAKWDGLLRIDASAPSAPALERTYATDDQVLAVAALDGVAYLAESDLGLEIVKPSAPTSPAAAGAWNSPGSARDLDLAGHLAYVADDAMGLRIVNVADPENPTELGAYNTAGYAYGVEACGTYAYVADDDEGLAVIDCSNPASPFLAGRYVIGNALDLVMDGDFAYVADSFEGLQIVDVSDPANPIGAGSYVTGYSVVSVAVRNPYVYIMDESLGLLALDATNPFAAREIWRSAGSNGTMTALHGNYLFAGFNATGILVFDVSNPALPVLLGAYDDPGTDNPRGIKLSGRYAFVADKNLGLYVLDLDDPEAPVRIALLNTAGTEYAVELRGNHAYIANGAAGLQVVDLKP